LGSAYRFPIIQRQRASSRNLSFSSLLTIPSLELDGEVGTCDVLFDKDAVSDLVMISGVEAAGGEPVGAMATDIPRPSIDAIVAVVRVGMTGGIFQSSPPGADRRAAECARYATDGLLGGSSDRRSWRRNVSLAKEVNSSSHSPRAIM
jgi:hypothetical protein